jgi:hypothetical protein
MQNKGNTVFTINLNNKNRGWSFEIAFKLPQRKTHLYFCQPSSKTSEKCVILNEHWKLGEGGCGKLSNRVLFGIYFKFFQPFWFILLLRIILDVGLNQGSMSTVFLLLFLVDCIK